MSRHEPDDPEPASSTQDTRDFAVSPADAPTAVPPILQQTPHVHYALNLDTTTEGLKTRSDPDFSRSSVGSPLSPNLLRRRTRVNTFKNIEDFTEFEARSGWHPGAEPGLDPYKSDGGRASFPKLNAECEITVVDFSQDNIFVQNHTNQSISPFLKDPLPQWSKCRWINVNGLSWDVVQALGQYKKLHKLSIEDIMNTSNRTKTDWYSNHAFLILTLQKLVHLCGQDSSDDDSEEPDVDVISRSSRSSKKSFTKGVSKRMKRIFGRTKQQKWPAADGSLESGKPTHLRSHGAGLPTASGEVLMLRTLQRYNATANEARTEFFEKHSSLATRNLAVIAEQVAIFITHDNEIISFFELSAQDVEKPILNRLYTEDTILRQSCDASMVGQAIIDAIIDLAIPVASVYADVIGDLELDVLTRPSITSTKQLYIVICEINKVLSFLNPVINLINALRDHRTEMNQEKATTHLQDISKGVIITPMTYTYLGDVLDHCVLITESLNGIKGNADGLIGLIFNTIAAYQNESMKQLTLATLFFLPLTFLTGYFGQNFEPFSDLNRGINFFWMIAAPMSFITVVILMRDMIWEYIKSFHQRRNILRLRKSRREKTKNR